jgi:hypothetical protein
MNTYHNKDPGDWNLKTLNAERRDAEYNLRQHILKQREAAA